MTHVLIRGGGVAAACCTHLLGRAGVRVAREDADRPRLPAILLSASAQQLISDVFDQPDLFRDLPAIRTRIVAWSRDAAPSAIPHSAIVITEEQLMTRLAAAPAETAPSAPDWTVRTSQTGSVHCFGSREAAAIPVELSDRAEPEACWIESIERGWLFLITTSLGKGWMLSVGESVCNPLANSRLIASRIARQGDAARCFPCAPRIAASLGDAGWLACGSAAMAFDPLCGDGTAHAVREAILASAVIQAAARGGDPDLLLAHYRARLIAAFQRHLSACEAYYGSGGTGPWWASEFQKIREGIEWCARQLHGHRGFRYRLEGFELMPLQSA